MAHLNHRFGVLNFILIFACRYGEIGIDSGLVLDTKEELYEAANGCLCCTGEFSFHTNQLLNLLKE